MGFIYIVTNKSQGVLYIGVISCIAGRIYEHKFMKIPGFTYQYNCHRLVYYEIYEGVEEAIVREKRLKLWRRAWKIELIEKQNPQWLDLYDEVVKKYL